MHVLAGVAVPIALREVVLAALRRRQRAIRVQGVHVAAGSHQRSHLRQVLGGQVERGEDWLGQRRSENVAHPLVVRIDVEERPHQGIAQQVLDAGQAGAFALDDTFESGDQRRHRHPGRRPQLRQRQRAGRPFQARGSPVPHGSHELRQCRAQGGTRLGVTESHEQGRC